MNIRLASTVSFARFPPSLCGALVAAFCLSPSAQAQTHKVAAAETVTRSVAVYEWTGELAKPTAARLVPVSLFINGTLEDGGTYYSRPVPLALLNGNIYSLEKAGVPQGNLTLDYARHLQTATSSGSGDVADLGWFGYGSFTPLPPPAKERPLKASATVPVIVSSKDDDRPSFAHKPSSDTDATSSKTSGGAKTSPAPATASIPDDPDRPRITKTPTTPAPEADGSAKPAPGSSTGASQTDSRASKDPADDADRPTLRHRDPKQAEADRKARAQSGVIAMPGSLNNDPDRPTMQRGKPTSGSSAAPQLSGLPVDLHQSVAVSDAVTRETHPFLRPWASPEEQAEIQKTLDTEAKSIVKKYAASNTLGFTPAPPAHDHKSNGKGVAGAHSRAVDDHLTLQGQQLSGYLLSYGGLPTFVYSAIGASDTIGSDIYVTIVAQRLPSGELQTAFSSATDAVHLNRTPWFRFIDAVDPDAGHRASLLFELRGQTTRQFALYRVLAANASQIFVTQSTD